jgi:hypothetical protein
MKTARRCCGQRIALPPAPDRDHVVGCLHLAARAVLRHARPPDAAHGGPNRTGQGSHDRSQARESGADRPGDPRAAPRDQHDRGELITKRLAGYANSGRHSWTLRARTSQLSALRRTRRRTAGGVVRLSATAAARSSSAGTSASSNSPRPAREGRSDSALPQTQEAVMTRLADQVRGGNADAVCQRVGILRG